MRLFRDQVSGIDRTGETDSKIRVYIGT